MLPLPVATTKGNKRMRYHLFILAGKVTSLSPILLM
jgi:hypothetical protein